MRFVTKLIAAKEIGSVLSHFARPGTEEFADQRSRHKRLSSWSRSIAKRIFDCVCVLLAMPLVIPVFSLVAVAVRLTSQGPVFFRQKRMGRLGRSFTILKFRTMIHTEGRVHRAIATVGDSDFTPVGLLLRRWKLDELPQLLNVLLGHMSLVGPRPKMLEHAPFKLLCRPGITGAATIIFAREEVLLDRVPKPHLEAFYHTVVLPAKRHLDAEYMARATFLSDLRLLLDSVLRRWDGSFIEALILEAAFEAQNLAPASKTPDTSPTAPRVIKSHSTNQPVFHETS